MSTLLTIIAAIIIFGIIIFVHELGHFLTARLFGVTVNEFAIGMGPVIYKKQGKNTLYSVRAIPMGGFCQMEAEDEESDSPGAFTNKKPWQRIIVLAAGAGMNILLGFVLVTMIVVSSAAANGGITSTTIASVEAESDAARFLQPGDKIVGINDTTVHIKRDLSFELGMYQGEGECELRYKRDGKVYSEKFTPMRATLEDGSPYYLVGFTVETSPVNLLTVLHEGFFQTIWMVKLVFVSLGMLFSGGASVSDLSGPVGVVSAMSTVAKTGLADFLFFAGFLAVNIGVMNLLPLPALDGGRIIFVLWEMIFRKPIPREKEGYVHFIGFVLLIGLMIFATWNDIVRLFTGG
ncbi:MAG: RIP metalloprotease RseP [Clostridiales bacterium]|nr:RIP metalloprotease RseP [Clostridiales bacterium]